MSAIGNIFFFTQSSFSEKSIENLVEQCLTLEIDEDVEEHCI